MKKERRKHFRVMTPDVLAVVEPNYNFSNIGGGGIYALKDISLGGAYLNLGPSQRNLQPQSSIQIRFALPYGTATLTLDATVRRVKWGRSKAQPDAKGFAVEWDNMIPAKRTLLEAYILYLRNHQIIKVAQKIIQDFYGTKNFPEVPK